VPRKLYSTREDCMDYRDFIAFMLAETDKTTDTSIDYWFKLVDLD
jgi:serine/threonine-protein phosphatase 2A regulatory subunit B''